MSVFSLLQIWKPGTSVGEAGVTVSMTPTETETVLFLKMDCDEARAELGITRSAKDKNKKMTCDYLVFYSRRSTNPVERRIVLCLLELKGSDTDHAVDQVIETRKTIRQNLQALKGSQIWPYIQRPVWKGYVCCNPKSTIIWNKQRAKEIEQLFEKDNFKVTHNNDLGNFLRS
jgi:hypothetical protein